MSVLISQRGSTRSLVQDQDFQIVFVVVPLKFEVDHHAIIENIAVGITMTVQEYSTGGVKRGIQ